MAKIFPRRLKDGDAVEPWMFNYIFAELERWRNVICIPPVMIEDAEGESPPVFSVDAQSSASLAITNGTVTARVTTTPGSGAFNFVNLNGTTLTTDTSGTTACFNFSSTTGGIATGTYVWVEQDPAGNWWITSVDCGN